jgi:hypothetical protein
MKARLNVLIGFIVSFLLLAGSLRKVSIIRIDFKFKFAKVIWKVHIIGIDFKFKFAKVIWKVHIGYNQFAEFFFYSLQIFHSFKQRL